MFSGLGSFGKARERPRIRRFERSTLDLPFDFRVFFNLSNLIGKFDNNLILPHVVFLDLKKIIAIFGVPLYFLVIFQIFHPCGINFIHNLSVV